LRRQYLAYGRFGKYSKSAASPRRLEKAMAVSPHSLAMRFGTTDLVDQFILTQNPARVPERRSRPR
jgi:hypothetical protein